MASRHAPALAPSGSQDERANLTLIGVPPCAGAGLSLRQAVTHTLTHTLSSNRYVITVTLTSYRNPYKYTTVTPYKIVTLTPYRNRYKHTTVTLTWCARNRYSSVAVTPYRNRYWLTTVTVTTTPVTVTTTPVTVTPYRNRYAM